MIHVRACGGTCRLWEARCDGLACAVYGITADDACSFAWNVFGSLPTCIYIRPAVRK